jgi:hypothetical protein
MPAFQVVLKQPRGLAFKRANCFRARSRNASKYLDQEVTGPSPTLHLEE